jgi:hypothetical protein
MIYRLQDTWHLARHRLHRVPAASPGIRSMVGLAAVVASVVLVVRVDSFDVDRGRVLVFVGGLGVLFVLLAATVAPWAAGPAAAVLALVPLPVLAAARVRDAVVELAVVAVLAIELTAWAADLRSVVREDAASIAHRIGEIAVAVTVAGGVAALALWASQVGGPHGRGALALGLVAALAAVGAIAWRAHQAR